MANYSSILVWRIPWTEGPGGLWPIGSQSQTRLKWLTMHTFLLLYHLFSELTMPLAFSSTGMLAVFFSISRSSLYMGLLVTLLGVLLFPSSSFVFCLCLWWLVCLFIFWRGGVWACIKLIFWIRFSFLAALGLHCCAFSSCSQWGLLSSFHPRAFRCGGFLVEEHRL